MLAIMQKISYHLHDDTIYNIMDAAKLAKIKRRIQECRKRANNLRHRDLESIAKALGRERSKKRTNEPTYISTLFKTNVLTIPDHSGTLKKGTALSILDQLEEDVYRFEEELEREAQEGHIDEDGGYEN